MNDVAVILGLLVLVVGIVAAFSESFTVYGITVYPHFWIGVAIGAVGFIILVLGLVIETLTKKEVEDKILDEAYGKDKDKRKGTGFQEQEMMEDLIKILKLRLAKGEISKEEYEELKRNIEA